MTAALIAPGWLTSQAPATPRLTGVAAEPLRIDLNRAPWYELTLLEGIGEARARRLVELRRERGGFRSLEDLESLPGMPSGWTERVRPFVTMGPFVTVGEAAGGGDDKISPDPQAGDRTK